MKKTFSSVFREEKEVAMPRSYAGTLSGLLEPTRIMMMPVLLGIMDTIPYKVETGMGCFMALRARFEQTLEDLFSIMDPQHRGEVGYLTIDEKKVKKGETHRIAGLHVDGVYKVVKNVIRTGGWGGGSSVFSSVEHTSTGFLTVSDYPGCRAWLQEFKGFPKDDGVCDHLKDQLIGKGTVLKENTAYWLDGLCVHESMPLDKDGWRIFIRLSMPSDGPWFDGYTENPLGIKPTGDILPRRPQMNP